MVSAQQRKWDKRYRDVDVTTLQAAEVLVQNRHLLPSSGTALDLACGLGANSLLLAEAGLTVSSWDISPVAISRLSAIAAARKLSVSAKVIDVESHHPEPQSLDVLVVSYFLSRPLAPVLMAALRPGGLLFYQTYCRDKVSTQGPRHPDYLLADNELLELFAGLKVRVYREESRLGNNEQGWRDRAMLVAEKSF